MAETTLKFTVDANGAITNIEKLGGSLAKFEGTSTQAQRGLAGLAGGLNNLKAGFDLVSGALGGVISTTAELVNLGTASRQAKEGLDALSGGRAVQYLEMMRASTRGLVPDTELLHSATKAMALGLAQTGDQLALLAKGGTILGRVMGIDAAQGVETLTVAMSRVGQTMLLDNIGLSATNVMKRFNELKKTMSDQDAWSAAVLEEVGKKTKVLEGNLDGAGSGVKRLENAFDSLKTSAGENLSYLIDQTLALVDATNKYNAAREIQIQEARKVYANTGTFTDIGGRNFTREMLQGINPAQGFAALGMSPGDYFRMLAGEQYGALSPTRFGATTPNLTSTIYTGYRTVSPDYIKSLQEQAARDAVRRQQMITGYGRFENPFLGASMAFTGLGQRFTQQSQLPDAMKTLNQIISGGQALLQPYAKGIENIAAAYDKATAAAKRGQSIAAAFGTGNGGLFGELNGGITGAFADKRAQVEQDLARRYGKDSQKYKTGLATFDAENKKAMDAYKIATGQATTASVYFEDKLSALYKRFTDGKISAAELTKAVRDLGAAAANSGGDLDAFMQFAGNSADASSHFDPAAHKGQKRWGIDPKSDPNKPHKAGIASGTERPESTDPFASLQTGLNTLDASIKGIQDKTTAIPGVMKSNFETAAANVQPLTKAVDAVQAKLNATLAQNAHIRITYEVIGGDSSAPPTRGRAF